MKRLLLPLILACAAASAAAQSPADFDAVLSRIAAGSQPVWGIGFEPELIVLYPSREQMYLYRRTGQQVVCDSTAWEVLHHAGGWTLAEKERGIRTQTAQP